MQEGRIPRLSKRCRNRKETANLRWEPSCSCFWWEGESVRRRQQKEGDARGIGERGKGIKRGRSETGRGKGVSRGDGCGKSAYSWEAAFLRPTPCWLTLKVRQKTLTLSTGKKYWATVSVSNQSGELRYLLMVKKIKSRRMKGRVRTSLQEERNVGLPYRRVPPIPSSAESHREEKPRTAWGEGRGGKGFSWGDGRNKRSAEHHHQTDCVRMLRQRLRGKRQVTWYMRRVNPGLSGIVVRNPNFGRYKKKKREKTRSHMPNAGP